ncbi:MAG: efflux RND transporter periplasmic adaptor subunit [Bacteroidetes bacterium]|nr:MAG: efflux RND transporter periplasmic adaptor subunit [Bacteroidota bacterium]
MKKRKKIVITVIAVAGLALIGYLVFHKKTPDIVLASERPHYGYIANTITATGTVQPVDTVAVGTQVSGTISKVYTDFNATVRKGQLLAELDKTVLNAQVQQVVASIQQAKSQLTYQQSNVNRQQQLYKVGAISKAELEAAQNEYKVAQAGLISANSQMQAAQKNLSLANIYSPIDGTVLSRNVSEGQTVAASFNTPTLFSIAKDLRQMQVRAAIDEADIGNIKKGQRVTFTVDAFPDDIFNGTLLEIRLQPSVSSNVVTYISIVDAPNNDLKLKPGMTANITVYTREENNALLVSAKATRFRPDSTLMKKYTIIDEVRKNRTQQGASFVGYTGGGRPLAKGDSLSRDSIPSKRASVWLLNGNTITRRFIRTGLEDGTQVQVLSGLTTGDEVITGAQQAGAAASANNGGNLRSPFAPQRRGGGGGSGGGNRGTQGGARGGGRSQ